MTVKCKSKHTCKHISCRHAESHAEQSDCHAPCNRDDGIKGSVCIEEKSV